MSAYAMIVALTAGGTAEVVRRCQDKGYDCHDKTSEQLMEWAPDITGKTIVVYSYNDEWEDGNNERVVQKSTHGSKGGKQYCCKYVHGQGEEYWAILKERTDN
jgi:hypothetical protein